MSHRWLKAPFPFAIAFIAMCGACDEDVTQPENRPPILTAIPDTTVILGDTLRGELVASDPEGDPLTYEITVLLHESSETDYVAAAGIDPITGAFWFVPGALDLPSRSIRFTVRDDGGNTGSTRLDVAVTYYVDQFNTSYTGGYNTVFYAPMGQEFTPAYSALDVVELILARNAPGSVFVRIRDGSITGTVLAASDTLAFAGEADLEFVSALFRFPRVALTPQNMYVLEIVQVEGEFLAARSDGSTYPVGRLILGGQVEENRDLWFKEGAISPRPPDVPTAPLSAASAPRVRERITDPGH